MGFKYSDDNYKTINHRKKDTKKLKAVAIFLMRK